MKNYIKIVLIISLSALSLSESYARSSNRENAIKAGFIYNFALYSTGEWFDPNTSDFYRICSNDSDFVKAAQITLANQRVKGKPVVATYIDHAEAGCHSLFIVERNEHQPVSLDSVEFVSTMIISESKNIAQWSGHINLFKTGGKIRFEIAPQRLNRSNIVLSSKVMRLGRVVDTPREPW